MTPAPDQPRSGELSWRLDAMEREQERHAKVIEPIPVMGEQMRQLRDSVESLKRVLWSIAGGLVLLTVSVLAAAAQIGGG